MKKNFKPLDMVCTWNNIHDVSLPPNERTAEGFWFAKVKWFDDKHFYGYSSENHLQDSDNLPINHFVVGAYDEGLGVTVIRFSANPKAPAMLYRAAPKGDGTYEGDFYVVYNQNFYIGNLFTKQAIKTSKVQYDRIGRGRIGLTESTLSEDSELVMDFFEIVNDTFFGNDFLKGIHNRYSSPECISDILADLQENVYPYETGREFEERGNG